MELGRGFHLSSCWYLDTAYDSIDTTIPVQSSKQSIRENFIKALEIS